MPSLDPVGAQDGLDAVEQARAWLTEQTGLMVGTGQADLPVTGTQTEPGGQTESTVRAQSARQPRSTGPTRPTSSARSASDHVEQTEPSPAGAPDSGTNGTADADADADADAESVARTIALRKLTASARTRHELGQALQKKNVPDQVATSVLDRLEEVGLVDDEVFAQEWVESRQRRRHLSRSALRRELRAKGVDREHVDAALSSVDTNDELAAARALVARKVSAVRGLDPHVRQRRLAGVLARRGFGPGIIATVLGDLPGEFTDDPGA